MKLNRRQFLGHSAIAALWISVVPKLLSQGRAWAGAAFRVPAPADAADPEKLPNAKAQKYVHFASDYKGPPKKAGAKCKNCLQFKPAKPGDAWGKCAMIGNKQAYEEGMCQVWMANPKVPV